MYVLLTKQADDTFDLPVLWRGSRVNSALRSHFKVSIITGMFKAPVTDKDRAVLGLFPVLPASRPAGKIYTVTPDTFDGVTVQEHVKSVVDPSYIEPDIKADVINALILEVKEEATRRIVDVTGAPTFDKALTRELNATMRAIELLRKRIEGGTWSVDEQAEVDNLQTLADDVKTIRAKSNDVEKSFDTMTLDQLRAFKSSDDSVWV